MNKKDLCEYKDRSKSRNEERIPVICNLILQLWINYKKHDCQNMGFYRVLSAVDSKGRENGVDTFYYEEDMWYDIISKMIDESKELKVNFGLKEYEIMDMQHTISKFDLFWRLHNDLRFAQIIPVFSNLVQKEICNLSCDYWNDFFDKVNSEKIKQDIQMTDDVIDRIQNTDIIKEIHSGFSDEKVENDRQKTLISLGLRRHKMEVLLGEIEKGNGGK